MPVAPSVDVARPARRARSTSNDGPAFWLAALAFSVALWLAGGFFALKALHSLYPSIVAVIGWPWLMEGTAPNRRIYTGVRKRQAALLVFVGRLRSE